MLDFPALFCPKIRVIGFNLRVCGSAIALKLPTVYELGIMAEDVKMDSNVDCNLIAQIRPDFLSSDVSRLLKSPLRGYKIAS